MVFQEFTKFTFQDFDTLILTQNQEKISFRIVQYNFQSEKNMRNKPKFFVLLRIFRMYIL